MNASEPMTKPTQHALLVAWGEFARQLGLIQGLDALRLHQKRYQHSPQTKVIEFLVATLAGLEHLKGLKYLRHLYVWQSKVTDAGVKGLKAALPNVEVSTGWESAERMKKADAEKK